MKFRLSTMFLWITTAGLAIGWFCERKKRFDETQRLDARLTEQASKFELLSGVGMVQGLNTAYSNIQQQQLGNRSITSYSEQKQEDLACCVICLYQTEKDFANDKKELEDYLTYLFSEPDTILKSSAKSFSLFEHSSFEQVEEFFASQYQDYKFGGYGEILYDKNKRLNPDFADFVRRSLEFGNN